MSDVIEGVLSDIREGKFVVVVDHEDRENEGDAIIAAEKITPEAVNFMLTHCKGLLCVSLPEERIRELRLTPMVENNTDRYQTQFTVSVDSTNTHTGISIHDRVETIRGLVDPRREADDFRRPGHVFPIKAEKGGILKRAGHTEATVDLSILAGMTPGGAMCEIIRDDGNMARRKDLLEFCRVHRLKMVSIADLIHYRLRTDSLVKRESESVVSTPFGDFRLFTYSNASDDLLHFALIKGEVKNQGNVLTRVHVESVWEDLLMVRHFPRSGLLYHSLKIIGQADKGVLVYLRKKEAIPPRSENPEERNPKERQKQKKHSSPIVPAGLLDYGIGACILRDIGLSTLRLLTNSQSRIHNLEGFDLKVTERVSLSQEDVIL